MALIKREYTDGETLITAKNLNDIQDAIIMLEGGLFTIDSEAKGEAITVTDAANRGFRGLTIYGKTTQDGTPTPDNPVELVSVGNGGSITVNVTGEGKAQSMTIATPNGLPGIPVTSGGNYTDANGQQWICDEIDLARGVYVHRVYLNILNGSENWNVMQLATGVQIFGRYDDEAGQFIERNGLSSIGYVSYEDLDNGGYGFTYAYHYRLRLKNMNPENNTLGNLKAYLTENPIVTLVSRETPIETPLSAEEREAYAALYTYRGNTTVSNDAGAYMALEYSMDAKKYIDGLASGAIIPATVE